jgi:DNA-binding NarL/FixJ family response regulator
MNTQTEKIKIALVDDHVLLRNALGKLINNFTNCEVVMELSNGIELIEQIKPNKEPDVILLDLNMPGMDGYATASWVRENYPGIHVLMLTMYDSEQALIRLLQQGVKGFLKKDIHPAELSFAINAVMQSGFYYSQHISGKMANLFRSRNGNGLALEKALLTDQEIDFLRFAASDLTYKEIAMKMKLNPRAVDSLRDHLFDKLEVKSRVGLAMYAIRQGIVAF